MPWLFVYLYKNNYAKGYFPMVLTRNNELIINFLYLFRIEPNRLSYLTGCWKWIDLCSQSLTDSTYKMNGVKFQLSLRPTHNERRTKRDKNG